MRSILRLFTLLLFCGSTLNGVVAQFGVSGFYRTTSNGTDLSTAPEPLDIGSGYEIAADYWFRLPQKRIEFLPTLSFANFSGETINQGPADGEIPTEYNLSEIGAQFKTNFYLFDFGTDCDCPTFGKQGPALHKGFFLQVAPGYSFFRVKEKGENERGSIDRSSSHAVFNLGFAAGIDFGVSNLITLSPQVGYRHYFGEQDWEGGAGVFGFGVDQEKALSAIYAGLRVGIRLDKRRY